MFPASGSIPEGWVNFTFRAGRNEGAEFDSRPPRLYAVENDARRELQLVRDPLPGRPGEVFLLTPATPPAAGTRLELEAEDPDCFDSESLRAQFNVGDAAAAPDTLGELRVTLAHQQLEVGTAAGSCSIVIDAAYADLELDLSESARPFADVVAYQLLVDGKPAAAFSASILGDGRLARGHERVYAPCQEYPALIGAVAQGSHRVRMRGELLDGTRVETPDVVFELTCADGTTVPDAGAPGLNSDDDAGSRTDEGPAVAPAGRDAGTPNASSDGGCTVSSARDADTGWFALVLGSAAVAATRMRSRRRSTGPRRT